MKLNVKFGSSSDAIDRCTTRSDIRKWIHSNLHTTIYTTQEVVIQEINLMILLGTLLRNEAVHDAEQEVPQSCFSSCIPEEKKSVQIMTEHTLSKSDAVHWLDVSAVDRDDLKLKVSSYGIRLDALQALRQEQSCATQDLYCAIDET